LAVRRDAIHYERPELCKNVARFKAASLGARGQKGELVGYDDDHPLPSEPVIATVSAGYVDGFPRLAHGQALRFGASERRYWAWSAWTS
jgi:alanine racemase